MTKNIKKEVNKRHKPKFSGKWMIPADQSVESMNKEICYQSNNNNSKIIQEGKLRTLKKEESCSSKELGD